MLKWNDMTSQQRNELVSSEIMDGTMPFSSDLAGAWEVVEKIYDNNMKVSLHHGSKLNNTGPSVGWLCRLVTGTGKIYYGRGTAPEAICLAALKAYGVHITEAEQINLAQVSAWFETGTHSILILGGNMAYDWSQMTPEERDELVSVKVMSQPTHTEHYSTDIIAAWKVLDTYLSEAGSVMLMNMRPADLAVPSNENLKWLCLVYSKQHGKSLRSFAATAPQAICLTALKYHGVDISWPGHP